MKGDCRIMYLFSALSSLLYVHPQPAIIMISLAIQLATVALLMAPETTKATQSTHLSFVTLVSPRGSQGECKSMAS